MYTVNVKIEQTSHTVFQQCGSHVEVLYTVKSMQSTLVVSWYKIQSNRNMENITNEANLKSWKTMQIGAKPDQTKLMSILCSWGGKKVIVKKKCSIVSSTTMMRLVMHVYFLLASFMQEHPNIQTPS